MFHCLKGLIEISNLTNQYCSKASFLFPDTNVFGLNKTTEIILPDARRDCRYFYGEYYVFASCLGRCINATCPLKRSIRWDSCSGQFDRGKIFTKDREGKLTFLIKDLKTGQLGNDLFLCENRKCITYDKVCNLADDCGDSSDEVECINHFKCHKSGVYLAINQKCDKTIHCSDISDECNESCGQEIVSSTFLKLVAWVIGVSGIFLNLLSIIMEISNIKTQSEAALLNKTLVILVSLGDLLIGIYLTMISVYNFYYNISFCSIQLNWLSSNTCITLGIISTTGSQVSLLSMTTLSLLRVFGIKNDFAIPKKITKQSLVKVVAIVFTILAISSVISWLPLVEQLEDFFVNGVKYDDKNSLFIGCPNKYVHGEILQRYYGRVAAEDLSWAQIKVLVDAMFSNDYGGITRYKLSFYYVKMNDPQLNFRDYLP